MSTSGSRAEAGLAWVSQRLTRKLTQPSSCYACGVGLGGRAGRMLATELTGDSLWVSLWIGKIGLLMRNVGFGLARLATFSRSILLTPVNQMPYKRYTNATGRENTFFGFRLTWLTSLNQ
jgi:hypothetical protein